MTLVPRNNNLGVSLFDNMFDDFFKDPFFTRNNAVKVMKTDIQEKDNNYVLDMDLPGYEKEGIKLEIQDGYLTVHASVNKEENDEEKIVAALVTSIIAAEQAQHTNFHVRSIKRVK